MKTLLLDRQTGLYFQGLQRWTDDPEQAFNFQLADRARQFIEIWNLQNTELVFAFTDFPGAMQASLRRAVRACA